MNGVEPYPGVASRPAAAPSAVPSDVQWDVLPAWQSLLLGPGGLRLGEWIATGQAQVVKHGARRTVYRVDLAERTIFLKHYRCRELWDMGRHLFRASASRREYRKAVELARRSVPTIRPIALGEAWRSGVVADNFLITEGIPHAVSLQTYVAQWLPQFPLDEQRRLRWKLTRAMARICAAAHEAGVFHDDFHGGNVLVRVDTCSGCADDPALPELFLVDLPGIRFSGPLNWSRSRQSLIMLNSDWSEKVSLVERWRFWRAYLAQREGWKLADPRRAAGEIAWLTRDYACRIQRGRAKRALHTNRDFYLLDKPHARGPAVADLAPADLVRLLEEPERFRRDAANHSANESGGSWTVRGELSVAGQAMPVAWQRLPARPWWHAWSMRTGRSRALWSWYVGHALLERGIATPRPLAVRVPRSWDAGSPSYLATTWIDGAVDLESYARRLATADSTERLARSAQCARSLGRLLGRMHAWRIAQRELTARNLLVREQPDSLEVWLANVGSIRLRRRLTYREQVQNLARLAASLARLECLSKPNCRRFFAAYVRELRPAEIDVRRIWQDVLASQHAFQRSEVFPLPVWKRARS
ncbi:MAG TPA: lipopolysaccharide kinase InaA family protein [Pirellulales bacterium]|nr:lipopolysaccharide kinase InaA family protein [Pirellulales bacterium]